MFFIFKSAKHIYVLCSDHFWKPFSKKKKRMRFFHGFYPINHPSNLNNQVTLHYPCTLDHQESIDPFDSKEPAYPSTHPPTGFRQPLYPHSPANPSQPSHLDNLDNLDVQSVFNTRRTLSTGTTPPPCFGKKPAEPTYPRGFLPHTTPYSYTHIYNCTLITK